MMSAWWLFLIVPVSACIGYAVCAVIVFLAEADASDVDGGINK